MAALGNLAAIGVTPGWTPSVGPNATMLAQGAVQGDQLVLASSLAEFENAGLWLTSKNAGTYGTDYLKRAITAKIGIGANLPEKALYFILRPDGLSPPIYGNLTATMTFPVDGLPPIKSGGFWSVTVRLIST
jgi:hypothetical protein